MRRILAAVVFACGVAAAGCDSSPTDAGVKPQYDGRTRTRTTTTSASDSSFVPSAPSDSTNVPGLGEPCNPETYTGPYQCVPDENSVTGYIVAT